MLLLTTFAFAAALVQVVSSVRPQNLELRANDHHLVGKHAGHDQHVAVKKSIASDFALLQGSLEQKSADRVNSSKISEFLIHDSLDDFKCRDNCEKDPKKADGPCIRNAAREGKKQNEGPGRCRYCAYDEAGKQCRLKLCQDGCDVKDKKCVPKEDGKWNIDSCKDDVCQSGDGCKIISDTHKSQGRRVNIGFFLYLISILALSLSWQR